MNYSDFRFTLDVQSNVSQVSIPVKLNDTGRRLLINLTDGGEPYNISEGSIAFFSYKKAEPNDDGEYEANILDCIIEDNYNTIRFDFLPEVTSVAGVVDCEIWLYGPNGRQLTSPRFILVVDERVMSGDDYPLPEDKISVLDSILTSEAERVDAEKKRSEAEEERDKTHRELKNILSNIYPVGSIYMSLDSTSPANLFGGTWLPIKDRFLIGAGNTYPVGAEGGQKTHDHGSGTLSALFGQPNNNQTAAKFCYKSVATKDDASDVVSVWTADKTIYVQGSSSSNTDWSNSGVDVMGRTSEVNSLPPYFAVYMWHRIA